MRTSSENDKDLYSRSEFLSNIVSQLSSGKNIELDTGYQLGALCVTPYEINDKILIGERLFNSLRFKTRVKIEQRFKKWTNMFQIF